MRLYLHNVPADVTATMGDLEEVTSVVSDPELANFFYYFIATKQELQSIAEKHQHLKAPGQILWLSWPKKASRIKSDVTEQDLRDILLPIGLVDTKVCSINDTYSGLKFVWRNR
jgi:hypothetical protein